MAEFHSSIQSLPHIPDNLTVAQFMLDYQHSIRPARNEDVPCLIGGETGRSVSIRELRESTYSLASTLGLKYEIGESDTVMIFSQNHIDYPVVVWAIHLLGGVVTCSNPQFNADELAYQLTTSKATVLIAHSSVLDTAVSAARLANIPSNRIFMLDEPPLSEPQRTTCVRELITIGLKQDTRFVGRRFNTGEGKTRTALLCWSSGTTGKPKAVEVSHYALIANIVQMATHNQVGGMHSSRGPRAYRPGDVAIGVLPFYHAAGLVITLHLGLFCGMSLVVVQKYDFLDMLDCVVRYGISHLSLVPPQAISLCKNPAVANYDLSKVKYIMIGAAPVSQEIQEKLAEQFPSAQIGQAYGLTEMTCTLAMIPASQKRGPIGSGGQLLPGVQARVIKADGSLARYGEPGELVVKGPCAALGYLNDDQATNETFVDGWIRTGDEVIVTSKQEVFVFDRLKEMLKVKGFQVAPAELEGCLLGHPDIVDSCVVGVPDVYSGEIPRAYVVVSDDAAKRISLAEGAADDIKLSVSQYIASQKVAYKHLKGGVQIVDSIPKNGSGKLLRRVLRNKAKADAMVDSVRAKL